jgi:hypothetical protein
VADGGLASTNAKVGSRDDALEVGICADTPDSSSWRFYMVSSMLPGTSSI